MFPVNYLQRVCNVTVRIISSGCSFIDGLFVKIGAISISFVSEEYLRIESAK